MNRYAGASRRRGLLSVLVVIGIAGMALVLAQGKALAQDAPPEATGPLRVAVKPIEPFVITRAREEQVDFSQPYYNAGLQIMARRGGETMSLGTLFQTLLSPRIGRIFGAFILAILVVALLAWVFEHRTNPEFPRHFGNGIWNSIWWAAVTVFTVGYGDKTPKSVPGRLIAMLWMGISLFLIANFTASLTAALTISDLRGEINGVKDLPGRSVATVKGSTSANFLTEVGVRPVVVPDVHEAVKRLQAGEVEAVVYDAPVLRYLLAKSDDPKLMLAGDMFKPENYGIALPAGSSYKERIDRALLALVENGKYADIKRQWFGVDASQ